MHFAQVFAATCALLYFLLPWILHNRAGLSIPEALGKLSIGGPHPNLS